MSEDAAWLVGRGQFARRLDVHGFAVAVHTAAAGLGTQNSRAAFRAFVALTQLVAIWHSRQPLLLHDGLAVAGDTGITTFGDDEFCTALGACVAGSGRDFGHSWD